MSLVMNNEDRNDKETKLRELVLMLILIMMRRNVRMMIVIMETMMTIIMITIKMPMLIMNI